MTDIDISSEAVEQLAHHDDIGGDALRFAPTLRALSASLTQSRAETAAAYERAAHEAWKYGGSGFEKAIRTIATPDQTAALDKLIAEAVKPYVEALAWYGEQARLARLIHSEGDAGRNALQADGGKRANALLAASKKGGV